jgi:hypothetical protein
MLKPCRMSTVLERVRQLASAQSEEEEQEDAVAGIVPFTAMEFNAHILDHEPEFVP